MSINFDRPINLTKQHDQLCGSDPLKRRMFLKTGRHSSNLKGLIGVLGISALALFPGGASAQLRSDQVLSADQPRAQIANHKNKQAFSGLPIVVAVMAKVPPANQAEFMAIATKTKELAADDVGILSYDFYKQHGTEDLYLIFIEVVSRKALDKHLATDHTKEFIATLDRIVSEPVSSRVFTIRGTDFVLGF
jgi:quinol monooxygenase YgiN